MPPRVQDVQPTNCDGQYGHGFNIWDEKGKLALTIGFASNEEAQKAFEEIKAIVARALFVTSPPDLL
jgi:hypothetical protein